MAKPATAATLRVLTTDPEPPSNLVTLDNTVACNDSYTCPCIACHLGRVRAMRRGVRPSSPLPVKMRAA